LVEYKSRQFLCRKRASLVLDYLRGEGFEATELQRVSAPGGFDLGARSPEDVLRVTLWH
jgi:xanthine/CO dehydrogenase XdhC/CoxF family maturation factor